MFSGGPCKCSINQTYLILADTVNRDLKLYDINDLSVLVCHKQIESEPCDVLLTQENLVFYKKSSDSSLILTEENLDNQVTFKNIQTSMQGFTMLEVAGQQVLVIGTPCSSPMKYTFSTYTV